MKNEIEELKKQLEEERKQRLELEKKLEELKKKEDAQHIWGRSNPLKFPASYYTRDVAQVNQPFLIFNINKNRPSCALARKRRMKNPVLRYALHKAIIGRILDAESLYHDPIGELQSRPWHLSLLEGIKNLTKPSKASLDKVWTMERVRIESEVFFGNISESESSSSEEDNDTLDGDYEEDDCTNKDMFLQVDKEVEVEVVDDEEAKVDDNDDGETTTSRASLHMQHEVQRNDIAVKVLDGHAFKHGQGDGLVVVLVVECKIPMNEHAIYQAMKYVFDRGMENYFENGRIAPIHAMVFSDWKWTYAVLDIYGLVELKNGNIVPESYQGLVANQKTRWKYMKKNVTDFAESRRFRLDKLEALLQSRRTMLRRSCSLNPNINYDDGSYIVGDVYVNTHNKNLPHGDDCYTALTPDALLFYETMLRIIVGDAVLSWTEADVNRIVGERQDLQKRKLDAVTLVTHSASKKQRC